MNQERLVDFMKRTDAVVKTAAAELQAAQADRNKAGQLSPQVVKLLVDTGWIPAAHTKIASERLNSHEGTMAILQELLAKQAQAKQAQHQTQPVAPAPLGRPLTPVAATAPTGDHLPITNNNLRQSWQIFDEGIGFRPKK